VTYRRWLLPIIAWALFAAYCVSGFPPCWDLGAHAAQLQTLAALIRGNPQVAEHFAPAFPIGYGLNAWLMLPVALVTNGAFAARFASWLTLMLMPLSHALLARSWGRSWHSVVLGLPFAFTITYWLGFLPTFFALPWVLFGWAFFLRGKPVALAVVSVGVFLCHLVAWGAFAVGLVALLALDRKKLVSTLGALVPALALGLTRVITLVDRAREPGERLPSLYDFESHVAWLFRTYGPAEKVALIAALLVAGICVLAWWRHRAVEPAAPAVLFATMVALYWATPKNISGACLVHVRLPVLAGLVSLLMVDLRRLPRALVGGLLAVTVIALSTVVVSHLRFAREVEGLDELISQPTPRGLHGGLSLISSRALGSRINLFDHLPEWWTATQGGVGHDFFADADHQPVQFLPGHSIPGKLSLDSPERLEGFESLLVLGEGDLGPRFREVARAGRWRRFDRVF